MKEGYYKFYPEGDTKLSGEEIEKAWQEAQPQFDLWVLVGDWTNDAWFDKNEEEGFKNFQKNFLETLRFDPDQIIRTYLSAQNFVEDRSIGKTRNIAEEVFEDYCKNAGNCEIIKLMLAKRECELLQELKDPECRDLQAEQLMAVRQAQKRSVKIRSPYDCLFERTEEMLIAQKELEKLYQQPSTPQSEARITELEKEMQRLEAFVDERSKDFDPRMLKSVADCHEKLVRETARAEALDKNHPDLVQINPDDLKVAQYVQKIAEERVKELDAKEAQ